MEISYTLNQNSFKNLNFVRSINTLKNLKKINIYG
jgi:hypothetical protein